MPAREWEGCDIIDFPGEFDALKEERIARHRQPAPLLRTEGRWHTGTRSLVTFETPILDYGGVFHELSSWEGTVLERHNDYFIARLVDPKGKRTDEEAELPLVEVQQFDQELVQRGAVFYWNVGYCVTGQFKTSHLGSNQNQPL